MGELGLRKYIGPPKKNKWELYTRFCIHCKDYFKTECKSRGDRSCPKCSEKNYKAAQLKRLIYFENLRQKNKKIKAKKKQAH